VNGKKIKKFIISPEQFGFEKCNIQDLVVDNPETAAIAIKNVLFRTEKGPKRNIVLLNAGAAIYANCKAKSILEGIEKARESIDSGKALKKLQDLIEASNN
jgi:anthranilate phosphoribosyltransferase